HLAVAQTARLVGLSPLGHSRGQPDGPNAHLLWRKILPTCSLLHWRSLSYLLFPPWRSLASREDRRSSTSWPHSLSWKRMPSTPIRGSAACVRKPLPNGHKSATWISSPIHPLVPLRSHPP